MTFWGKKEKRAARTRADMAFDGAFAQEAQTAPPPPKQDGRWLGYIDSVSEQSITGWCCDAHHPDASVAVEAIASNGRRLVTVASIFRSDVMEAGWGNGNHGFEIDVSKLEAANGTVIVRFLENQFQIGAEPLVINSKDALLSGKLPQDYLVLMRQLAMDVQAHHAELKADAAHT